MHPTGCLFPRPSSLSRRRLPWVRGATRHPCPRVPQHVQISSTWTRGHAPQWFSSTFYRLPDGWGSAAWRRKDTVVMHRIQRRTQPFSTDRGLGRAHINPLKQGRNWVVWWTCHVLSKGCRRLHAPSRPAVPDITSS
ncbi:hypothetical protein NPIL_133461 [Nephila pilipes]|uniref:Uncharacterized protein n=1 Tax=Nephila pilipes TaxID=299642 RepID=A0A8X6MX08_NEPPI|nr:hypothetical protein NPIL_133461 [Nephila pilipes]